MSSRRVAKSESRPKVEWRDLSFIQFGKRLLNARKYGHEFEGAIEAEVVEAAGLAHDERLEGQEAWARLCVIERELETRARGIAQDLSSAEWLWYLRRSRFLYEGINYLGTTAPYIASIAEGATSWSATPGQLKPSSTMTWSYPPTDEAARAVMRLNAVSALLYDAHSALRWAGKGAPIQCRPSRIPANTRPPGLRKAIRLYDRRVDAEGRHSPLARAGLYLDAERIPESDDLGATIPVVSPASRNRYSMWLLDLKQVPLLVDERLPVELRWPQALVDLIVVLWSSALSDAIHEKIKVGILPWRDSGYRVVNKTLLLNELHKAIAVLDRGRLDGQLPIGLSLGTPEEVFSRILHQEASVWPPTGGPVLRHAVDEWYFLDLAVAGMRLHRAVSRPPVTGSLVNAWADHFERGIQGIIDGSAWSPPPDLARLRNRTLRLDGQPLTDVDVIGASNGSVLLVSCKSRPKNDAFERGEYREVRNMASHTIEAVSSWATIVDILRRRPVGDNYDLSRFDRKIGVVVYPSTPWVPSGPATAEMASGLPGASNPGELADFCARRRR